MEKDFATAITLQDIQIGQVLQQLTDSGLADDTVVFLASDNGAHNEGGHDYTFFNSSGLLKGFKRSLHQGGYRSPIIVRWPGITPAGSVSDQQFAFYDFMATAAEIAGDTTPLPGKDGRSIVPTLKGGRQSQPAFVYHEYCGPNELKTGWGQVLFLIIIFCCVRTFLLLLFLPLGSLTHNVRQFVLGTGVRFV